MLKDCNALRTVTDLFTEHLQTNFPNIDAIVGKYGNLYGLAGKGRGHYLQQREESTRATTLASYILYSTGFKGPI